MILDLAMVVLGLVCLTLGADFLVRGVVKLSLRLGLSKMLVSLTVVALGTSLPEFFVVLKSILAEAPGIGMGNIVGSNIANLCLILAVAALIRPLAVDGTLLRRDGLAMLAASGLFVTIALVGQIGLLTGLLFIALLMGYLTLCVLRDGPDPEACEDEIGGTGGWRLTAVILGGAIGLILGAEMLVVGGVSVARALGVSETVIGLTLVAIGTSLPELATCVAAVLRRQAAVVLGNVLGSNIFNLMGVLGLAGLVAPLTIPRSLLQFDIWIMLGVSLAAFALLRTEMRLDRWEGGLLLSVYAVYIAIQFGLFPIALSGTETATWAIPVR